MGLCCPVLDADDRRGAPARGQPARGVQRLALVEGWRLRGHRAREVQAVTGDAVEVAFVDQGYTGDQPAETAAAHGMHLEVVKLPEGKKGFVLLPRRWVVERSVAWVARFRSLARDYERLPATLAGFHLLAFVILLLKRFVEMMVQST
jgi:transposase